MIGAYATAFTAIFPEKLGHNNPITLYLGYLAWTCFHVCILPLLVLWISFEVLACVPSDCTQGFVILFTIGAFFALKYFLSSVIPVFLFP